MDGWTDGRTDRRMDGWMDGWMDKRDGLAKERKDGRTEDGRMIK